MRKIGIFLGSFDPPHIGHINIIRNVYNIHFFDEIFVVPAYRNLWKPKCTLFTDRITMCKKAFKPFKGVTVSNAESMIASMDMKTYRDGVPSWKTIEYFKKVKDREVYIITTSETFEEMKGWENGFNIISENKFLILHNPLWNRNKDLEEDLPKQYNLLLMTDAIDVSSTLIRNYICFGNNPYPLVPTDVLSYIYKHNLYLD